MTNFTKDFLDYQAHGYENSISQYAAQEQELKEKKHMLSVHYSTTSLEKMINTKKFSKNKIEFILISNYLDIDSNKNLIRFGLLDKDKKHIDMYDGRGIYKKCMEETKSLLATIKNFQDFVNDEFKNNIKFTFPLNKEGMNDLRNLLLCEKLQITLNHVLLENQLNEKPTDNKKMKI